MPHGLIAELTTVCDLVKCRMKISWMAQANIGESETINNEAEAIMSKSNATQESKIQHLAREMVNEVVRKKAIIDSIIDRAGDLNVRQGWFQRHEVVKAVKIATQEARQNGLNPELTQNLSNDQQESIRLAISALAQSRSEDLARDMERRKAIKSLEAMLAAEKVKEKEKENPIDRPIKLERPKG